MSRVESTELKLGQVFYECQSGVNLKLVVTEEPSIITNKNNQIEVRWKAKRIDGSIVDYMENKSYSAYAPRIYSMPQYMKGYRDSTGEYFLDYEVI